MKQAHVLLLAFLALTCSNNMNDAGVSLVTGDAHYDSTDTMRFEIEQASYPQTFPNQSSVDVCFRITITNQAKEPITIRRLTLQSMGAGSYRLETSSRKFNKVIAAGDKESFRYWAPAVAGDVAMTTAPLVVRTAVDAVAGDSRIRAVFNRRVNGEITVAIGSGH